MAQPSPAAKSTPATIEAAADGTDVSIFIDGDKKFSIRSSDLEAIGAQLRGRKSFSVFNYIFLPIGISLLTVIGTTLVSQTFQYVSWRNATTLQQVTDQSARAVAAYDRASLAIGERIYGSYLFISSVRDLANRQSDVDSHLYQLDLTLLQKRFNEFYAQLKKWNENYDQILSDIDFHMDRPVLKQAIRVRKADLMKVSCKGMLLDELERANLKKTSLKTHFAAINFCFANSINAIRTEKDRAVMDKDYRIDETVRKEAEELIDSVHAMANEFRCYAQSRIVYFEAQKQKAIFKLSTWVNDRLQGLLRYSDYPTAKHFKATEQACDPR